MHKIACGECTRAKKPHYYGANSTKFRSKGGKTQNRKVHPKTSRKTLFSLAFYLFSFYISFLLLVRKV
jgi:hypothetical protein